MGEHIFFEEELFMTKGKKFFLGMAVLLMSASLFIIGCTQDPEIIDNSKVIHIDTVVTSAQGLADALASNAKVIEVIAEIEDTNNSVPVIPEGKTVIIVAEVTPGDGGLSIEGTVYVGGPGELVVADGTPVSVKGKGVLNVGYAGGGTLSVDAAESLDNGAGETVLSTAKVSINGGTLKYTAAAGLDPSTNLGTWVDYITKGGLETAVTASSSTPTLIANAVTGKVSKDKTLTVTATAATGSVQSLNIPAGLILTTNNGDEMAESNFTSLTVHGTLIAADATLEALTSLTVNGTLEAEAATLAAATAITVNGTLTVGDAAPLGDVTVGAGGTLNVPDSASLTIVAGKKLANAGTVALAGTGELVLTTAATQASADTGAKITGAGKLTAAALEITGEWQAIVTSADAEQSVTIAGVTGGQATITGTADSSGKTELKGGAGGRITQKAGTTSNKLTLTTVTIDVSANGEVVLKGAGTNGASLVLVDATAIIKAEGTTGGSAVDHSKITSIGGVLIANITIATNVVVTTPANPGGLLESVVGASSNNNLDAKTDNEDVVLSKTTFVAVSA
jgi:hypothetical protein